MGASASHIAAYKSWRTWRDKGGAGAVHGAVAEETRYLTRAHTP